MGSHAILLEELGLLLVRAIRLRSTHSTTLRAGFAHHRTLRSTALGTGRAGFAEGRFGRDNGLR